MTEELSPAPATEPFAIDPVCGMRIQVRTSVHSHVHEGATYHFCCAGCLEKFRAAPAEILSRSSAPAPEPPKGATYTCPMHPEVVNDGPGDCPQWHGARAEGGTDTKHPG